MIREPYERDGRIIIEDPYVSEFGTEPRIHLGACCADGMHDSFPAIGCECPCHEDAGRTACAAPPEDHRGG